MQIPIELDVQAISSQTTTFMFSEVVSCDGEPAVVSYRRQAMIYSSRCHAYATPLPVSDLVLSSSLLLTIRTLVITARFFESHAS